MIGHVLNAAGNERRMAMPASGRRKSNRERSRVHGAWALCGAESGRARKAARLLNAAMKFGRRSSCSKETARDIGSKSNAASPPHALYVTPAEHDKQEHGRGAEAPRRRQPVIRPASGMGAFPPRTATRPRDRASRRAGPASPAPRRTPRTRARAEEPRCAPILPYTRAPIFLRRGVRGAPRARARAGPACVGASAQLHPVTRACGVVFLGRRRLRAFERSGLRISSAGWWWWWREMPRRSGRRSGDGCGGGGGGSTECGCHEVCGPIWVAGRSRISVARKPGGSLGIVAEQLLFEIGIRVSRRRTMGCETGSKCSRKNGVWCIAGLEVLLRLRPLDVRSVASEQGHECHGGRTSHLKE